jgi:outer membrane immunogenic protein
MKKLLVAGFAFGALIAPAMAADLPLKAAPPPVVVSTWTGCYIGGSVGGAWAKSDWTYRNVNPYSSFGPAGPIVPGDNAFTMSSWIAGVQGGCNYEFQNRWVIGAEGSWSGSDLNRTIPNYVQVFAPFSTQTVSTGINSLLTVTGRLGYSFSPGWLGYVKGGYATARVETTGVTNPPLGGLVLNWTTSQWHDGFIVGVGGEYKITQNFTLGVEYNYVGLSTSDHVGPVSGGFIGPDNQIVHRVNGNIQSVMARANFLFGSGSAPLVARY